MYFLSATLTSAEKPLTEENNEQMAVGTSDRRRADGAERRSHVRYRFQALYADGRTMPGSRRSDFLARVRGPVLCRERVHMHRVLARHIRRHEPNGISGTTGRTERRTMDAVRVNSARRWPGVVLGIYVLLRCRDATCRYDSSHVTDGNRIGWRHLLRDVRRAERRSQIRPRPLTTWEQRTHFSSVSPN